jgi:hypothetical protein
MQLANEGNELPLDIIGRRFRSGPTSIVQSNILSSTALDKATPWANAGPTGE